MGLLVPFAEVKVGIGPLPESPRPMAVFEFVHVYEAPAGVLIKSAAGTDVPGQKTKSGGVLITGRLFTTTVNSPAGLTHPPTVAVTT